jgi:Zn ribbon nucleic-acid-binding protein
MAIGSTTEFAKVGESIRMKVTFQKIILHREVDIKSIECTKCGLNNPEHATKPVCSHCRVSPKGQRVKGVWETVAAWLKGLVVKDRESVKCDALPPSVISD